MNTWDKCKNCGGERGLHHYETDQCPVGGREAPIGRKQEWKATTFEIDDSAKDARIAELEAALKNLVDFCLENPAVYDGAARIKKAIKLLKGN